MAEVQQNALEIQKGNNVAEKESTEILQEKSNNLFDLLLKKELSEDEKKKIQDQIIQLPEILISKEFTTRFEMPDLLSKYKAGMDLQALVETNTKAREKFDIVLNNLKDVEMKGNVSAAKYMLDNAWLSNGELFGTQFVKNIHFLGAASQETKEKGIQDELNASLDVYKSMYDKDGYNANPNRRNYLGQKTGDVMEACMKMPKKNIEDIKNQVFIQSVNPRLEMQVDQARKTMTLDQLREGSYRGTLTAEQADQLKKMEKEADLVNNDGDHQRYDEDKKKDKFKDMDIIKYMYEEWFLAGLDWVFGAIESGMEICIHKLFYDKDNSKGDIPNKKASIDGKKLLSTVNAFNQASADNIEKIHSDYNGKNENGQHIDGKRGKCIEFIKNLSDFSQTLIPGKTPDTAKEADLKMLYGESFIDHFKEDYQRNPEAVKKWMDKGALNMLLAMETSSILAQRLAQAEMTSEVMNQTETWLEKKKDKFKDIAELETERNQRAEKIQKELMTDALIVAEEERAWAEIRYENLMTPEEKDQFIKDEVLDVSDANQKEKLGSEYETLKANGSEDQIKQWVSETISAQRVMGFFEIQRERASDALRLIRQDLTQGNYQANGKKTLPDAADCLRKLKDQRFQIQKDGAYDAKLNGGERLKKTIEHADDLFEAAKKNNLPSYFENKRKIYDEAEQLLGERREKNNKRLEVLKTFKKGLTIEKNSKYTEHNYNFKPQQTR